MRGNPKYFIFWLPATCVCALNLFAFLSIWPQAPPSGPEMENLGALMTFYVAARFLPLSVVFFVLLFFYPRLSAIRLHTVLPTILVSTAVFAVIFFWIRSAQEWQHEQYTFPLRFVDTSGTVVSNIKIHVKWIGPELLKPVTTQNEFVLETGIYNLTKERLQSVQIRIEKDGFYNSEVDVGQWVKPQIKNYTHKIDITWTKDWKGWIRGTMINTSKNWHPESDGAFKLVMIKLNDPLVSPYPEYTDKDVREIEIQNGMN